MTNTQTENDAADPNTVSEISLKRKRVDKVNDLDESSKRLQTAFDEFDSERAAQLSKIQHKQTQLHDRQDNLDEEKTRTAAAYGNADASDDDLIEINAGGKVVTAKRAAFTQLQLRGSRLAAMFSGRWDRKLARDSSGRIFLDINGNCFQAIVDYLNELAISSEDEPPEPPTVDDELDHILAHQIDVFGITVTVTDPPIDSTIVTEYSDTMTLRNWLKEDGSDVELELLYRSSSDGLTNHNFHSNCDEKGPTVVIIETSEGDVVGGYTNNSWSSSRGYASADKAFLFALSGSGLSSPCKMNLKNRAKQYAIYRNASYGPTFGGGHDLRVNGSTLTINNIGNTYERCPYSLQSTYSVEDMEVFQVINKPARPPDPSPCKQPSSDVMAVEKAAPVNAFTKEINDAINEKWTKLHEIEVHVLALEENFKDEKKFIESLGGGATNDILSFNASGTMMTTSRDTLQICQDSVLAQQLDNSKRTAQGCRSLTCVRDWSPEDVTNWAKSLGDVSDDIAALFLENDIKGSELLALNEYGLEKIGVKRAGTVCLLMKEIKQLEEASQDTATLIEYSPYCFGKILDYLRLKRLHALGLIDEPALPVVCESQKKRFEKVVKYYFPGECSKFILG